MNGAVNWSPSTIFDARDAGKVIDRMGKRHMVRLYNDGWVIGHVIGMDVWTACRFLNDIEARLLKEGLT